MRMQVLVPAAALILMSAVGGCSADSSDNASKTTETSASTTPPTTTLPPPPQPPKLVWAPCVVGPGTECADLTVPIDYAEPDGETISIAVTRIPADPTAERIGTLVVNPGGPGVPSRYLAPVLKMGADAVPAEAAVLDRFDIVSFDPRGVGESNPVDCGDTSALDLADYSPESPAEMANLKATMKAFAAACEENTGPLLQHMSTIETARDVEQMRRALGEDKLNLLGFSYGTELFGTYADLFPERVRTAVLDGVIPSEITGVEVYGRQAASVERHFQRFLDACDAAGLSDPRGRCRDVLRRTHQDLGYPCSRRRRRVGTDRQRIGHGGSHGRLRAHVSDLLRPGPGRRGRRRRLRNRVGVGLLRGHHQGGITVAGKRDRHQLRHLVVAIGRRDVRPGRYRPREIVPSYGRSVPP